MRKTVRMRARVADTNARGRVDDAKLLMLFEAARADAVREVGLPYSEIVARGLHALTVEARLQNHAPARALDLLLVHTWVADIGRVRFTFAYEIRRERDGELVATGQTVHVCIDSPRGQPGRLPDWMLDALSQLRATDLSTGDRAGQ